MNYGIFKLNNYVEYYGRLTNLNNRVGLITSVDRWNGEDTFELTLRKRYPTDTETQIRAYLGEVRPITLTDDFLKKNNFQFNEQTSLYKRDTVVIYRPAFIKNTNDFFGNKGLCWDDKGFRIINSVINDYSNEIEVLEKTTSVHSVNALQNYFEVVLNNPFEVNWN